MAAPVPPTPVSTNEAPASSPVGSSEPARASGWSSLWWAILAIAAIEVIGHFVIQSRVPPPSGRTGPAAPVRGGAGQGGGGWRGGGPGSAGPGWPDPLLGGAAGELLDRPRSGRSDTAAYARLWVVSIRGHRAPETPDGPPEASQDFGRVRVERWALAAPSVLYDFVEHVGDARVSRRERGADVPCRLVTSMGQTQGGLSNGPIEGAPRHLCDPGRDWLWVGATTTMDLELRGRRCVSQHPQGAEPIVTAYDDVPLGDAVVLHGGLWWERERWRNGGDVEVVIRLDGEEIGRATHHDGDGWKRMEASIPEERRGGRGTLSVEVSAESPDLRAFCWAGSTRGAAR